MEPTFSLRWNGCFLISSIAELPYSFSWASQDMLRVMHAGMAVPLGLAVSARWLHSRAAVPVATSSALCGPQLFSPLHYKAMHKLSRDLADIPDAMPAVNMVRKVCWSCMWGSTASRHAPGVSPSPTPSATICAGFWLSLHLLQAALHGYCCPLRLCMQPP